MYFCNSKNIWFVLCSDLMFEIWERKIDREIVITPSSLVVVPGAVAGGRIIYHEIPITVYLYTILAIKEPGSLFLSFSVHFFPPLVVNRKMSAESEEFIRRHHKHQTNDEQCTSTLVKHIKAPVHLVIIIRIHIRMPLFFPLPKLP